MYNHSSCVVVITCVLQLCNASVKSLQKTQPLALTKNMLTVKTLQGKFKPFEVDCKHYLLPEGHQNWEPRKTPSNPARIFAGDSPRIGQRPIFLASIPIWFCLKIGCTYYNCTPFSPLVRHQFLHTTCHFFVYIYI